MKKRINGFMALMIALAMSSSTVAVNANNYKSCRTVYRSNNRNKQEQ